MPLFRITNGTMQGVFYVGRRDHGSHSDGTLLQPKIALLLLLGEDQNRVHKETRMKESKRSHFMLGGRAFFSLDSASLRIWLVSCVLIQTPNRTITGI